MIWSLNGLYIKDFPIEGKAWMAMFFHRQPASCKKDYLVIMWYVSCYGPLLLLWCRPVHSKVLLSILQTAKVHIFRFLTRFFADAPPISQNEAVSKVNFSIIHLVRTVCELTFSIIQTHNTRTTLFCLHLRKSFSIEDRRTLSPKTMHRVCCFRWCRRVLSWTVVVWLEFVSLVSCILPPLCRFRAATYHRQLQTRHIWRWLTSVKFRCKVNVHWFNKLFWPIRTGCILQARKWLEICKCRWTVTPHQRVYDRLRCQQTHIVHVMISVLSRNSVSVF